ncbi:SUN domain-containing protein [Akanthomyces lecanii RCEF 1005]|uniref:SUN domain-containing protein n=1 Tax=Akanthomyces lecanii RCEF 1005 TaxID=1081108 RepID=A0A167XM15_CORDF|nr:SUN domain-containing protein [Akanthomyces lecanii RCEF 1005]
MKPSQLLILGFNVFVASSTHYRHSHSHGTQRIHHKAPDEAANASAGPPATAGQIEDLRKTDASNRLRNRLNSACVVRTVTAVAQTYIQSPKSKLTAATATSVTAEIDNAPPSSTSTVSDISTSAVSDISASTASGVSASTASDVSASTSSDVSASTPSVNSASQDSNLEETEFPTGKIRCSDFPSQHGAVPISWRNLHGWIGLQHVPDFTPGSESIDNIIDSIDCAPSTMCSYACKPGFQKSQWPRAQGSKGQSVGGLYCNMNGYLELTRPSVHHLCTRGEGGVFVKNDLSEEVVACRTDYPGTEGMFIPTVALPGEQVALTNPSQTSYYLWGGKQTSAQYYINPKGVGEADACIWGDASSTPDRGNWAPIIVGVGKSTDNFTYVGLFLNQPTSTAKLDFNIEVVGGSIRCAYVNGQWYGGSTGCTSAFSDGKTAIIRYF